MPVPTTRDRTHSPAPARTPSGGRSAAPAQTTPRGGRDGRPRSRTPSRDSRGNRKNGRQSSRDSNRSNKSDKDRVRRWGEYRTDKNGKKSVYYCTKFFKNNTCDNKEKHGKCRYPHMTKEQVKAENKKLRS